jgi:hypothetical protein
MYNKKTSITKSQLFAFTCFCLLSSLTAISAENKTQQGIVSYADIKVKTTDSIREQVIKNNASAIFTDQIIGKASGKTRTNINLEKMLRSSSNQNTQIKSHQADYLRPDFSIYNAVSFLQDDYDFDGYFQSFTVTFDADVYSYTDNQIAEVYALLYLSTNGGPWIHYYTTDSFIIEGNTDADQYEVITTLLSGYPPESYDVLIDLYQTGYEDIVATYSSADTNALYALPIESSDFDTPYVEVIETIEVSNGGSSTIISLLMLLVLITRGLFNK